MFADIQIDILLAVGEKGGVENVVNRNAVHLRRQGFHVRVVQIVWEGVCWVAEEIPFYPLLEGRGDYLLEEFVAQYAEFLSTHDKPDIILATAWPMMTLVARMSMAQLGLTCKIVSWLHAPVDRYVAAGYGGMECLQKADRIFVLTEKAKRIIGTYDHIPGVDVVRNPVDFTKCNICFGNNWDRRTLLFVGRLSVEKRIDVILHALSLAREKWQLILIGDGEERERLEGIVSALQLDGQVSFQGWRPDPWECVQGVSALVLASEYEGFPVAAIESLASGIPVIATPVDGITEIIRPGVNGFLYPQGDSVELGKILDMLSTGFIPATDPMACRDTVAAYEEEDALADFEDKLIAVI